MKLLVNQKLNNQGLLVDSKLCEEAEKILDLNKGLKNTIIMKIKGFSRRNSLHINSYSLNQRMPNFICCDRCLKTYLLELGKDKGISSKFIEKVNSVMKCETGHNGYYIDNGKFKKII